MFRKLTVEIDNNSKRIQNMTFPVSFLVGSRPFHLRWAKRYITLYVNSSACLGLVPMVRRRVLIGHMGLATEADAFFFFFCCTPTTEGPDLAPLRPSRTQKRSTVCAVQYVVNFRCVSLTAVGAAVTDDVPPYALK